MALSVIVYPGDGVRTQFNIPFSLGYIKESDVTARVDGEVDGAGNQLFRTLVFLSPEIVEVQGTVVPVGTNIIFERTVVQDALIVDYEDGDIINEDNMNTSQKQMIMLVHQVLDGRFSQFQTDVDVGGFRITGLGAPVDATDAANKSYVDARIATSNANAAAAAASAAAAAGSAASAGGSAGAAGISANAAFRWASEQEDVLVNDGVHSGYSAYNWAAKAAAAAETVIGSSVITPGVLMRPRAFFGMPTLDVKAGGAFFLHAEGDTGGTDVHSVRIDRRADYTGGTAGFENAALLVRNFVSASATQSYEDAGLFILDNASPGPSMNSAGRFVGKKLSTGSTWSLANEAIDFTGTADPTLGLIGIEQVVAANGTDVNNNRVGFDAVIARPQVDGSYSGTGAQGGAAFRATNQIADTANNRWKVGFEGMSVGASTGFDIVFDSAKASIAPTGVAVRLGNGQKLAFTTNMDITVRYDAGAIRYNNSSVDHWVLENNGSTNQFGVIKISGTQVVTSRRTGWAGDIGTASRAAHSTFTGTASATYSQAEMDAVMAALKSATETIKALKDDLFSHGLIGL